MLNFGLYARKSHDDKKVTEKSIGEQVIECERVMAANALFVARTWKESRSARIPNNRVFWSELIREVKRGKIDGIICWHINRLVRNMEEGGELVQLFVDGKIKEIRTPHSTYRTGDNILPLVLEAASATQYSIDLKHAVERSMEAKFQAGGWNGKAPQGYLNLRDLMNTRVGKIGIDKERFLLIGKAWDLMLTGNYTVDAVLNTLNDGWGYRTRRTKNGGGGPLSSAALYHTFRNPFYAGFVRRRGKLVVGTHKAMVTPQQYEQMQTILSRRTFQAKRIYRHPYTGVMTCGYCGQQITAERKRLLNGSLWDTYHCSDSYKKCTKRGMSREWIESAVAGAIESISIEPELARVATQELENYLGSKEREIEGVRSKQLESMRDSKTRLNKLVEMWMEGLITDRDRYLELEKVELAAINTATIRTEGVNGELEHMRENLSRVSEYVSCAKDKFLVAPEAQKRALIKSMVTEIKFYGTEKKILPKVHPLLEEFITFAILKSRPLEPMNGGSGSTKTGQTLKVFYHGRAGEKRVEQVTTGNDSDAVRELPESLLAALRGPLFPDAFRIEIQPSEG